MMTLAIPLIALYEVTLWVIRLTEGRRAAEIAPEKGG
jgi:Sec-independent protein secretion pathway component TatC